MPSIPQCPVLGVFPQSRRMGRRAGLEVSAALMPRLHLQTTCNILFLLAHAGDGAADCVGLLTVPGLPGQHQTHVLLHLSLLPAPIPPLLPPCSALATLPFCLTHHPWHGSLHPSPGWQGASCPRVPPCPHPTAGTLSRFLAPAPAPADAPRRAAGFRQPPRLSRRCQMFGERSQVRQAGDKSELSLAALGLCS